MATNDELQAELAMLRDEVRLLRTQVAAPLVVEVAGAPRLLSRRNLLRAAPIAAVGGAIAAMSETPATAAAGNPLILGAINQAGTSETELFGGSHPSFGT